MEDYNYTPLPTVHIPSDNVDIPILPLFPPFHPTKKPPPAGAPKMAFPITLGRDLSGATRLSPKIIN